MEGAVPARAGPGSSATCSLCVPPRVFKNEKGLNIHLGRNHRPRVHVAPVENPTQNPHLVAFVAPGIALPFKCSHCERRFKSGSGMRCHVTRLHKQRPAGDEIPAHVNASRADHVTQHLTWSEHVRLMREQAVHVHDKQPASVQFQPKLPKCVASENQALHNFLSDNCVDAEILKARTAPSKESFVSCVDGFLSKFCELVSASRFVNEAKNDVANKEARKNSNSKVPKKQHFLKIIDKELKTLNQIRRMLRRKLQRDRLASLLERLARSKIMSKSDVHLCREDLHKKLRTATNEIRRKRRTYRKKC